MNTERLNELETFVQDFNGQLEESLRRYEIVKNLFIPKLKIKKVC